MGKRWEKHFSYVVKEEKVFPEMYHILHNEF